VPDTDREAGIFLSLIECTHLFPGLKEKEASLNKDERRILLKIEKVLYDNLSIQEVDELTERNEGKASDA